jgi:5-methyltetrahydropteroyltriglutamate--homocysteine methyltransferase
MRPRPAGMTFGMHLCRGNLRGTWLSSGGYEYVAEAMFGGVEVDAFFLEFDSARAGDFTPLRFVPKNRRVVLGLISSKTPVLEKPDELRRRIDDAARHVDLDRLSISPQCGFASTVAGNPVAFEDQVKKLDLVIDTARKVWGGA